MEMAIRLLGSHKLSAMNCDFRYFVITYPFIQITGRKNRGKEENHTNQRLESRNAVQYYLYESLLNSEQVNWLNEIKRGIFRKKVLETQKSTNFVVYHKNFFHNNKH